MARFLVKFFSMVTFFFSCLSPPAFGKAPECGDFMFTCLDVQLNNATYQASGYLRFDGVTSGLFYLEYNVFTYGCDTRTIPDLYVTQNGTYVDLGDSKTSTQTGARSIMIYPSAVTATPLNASMTTYLTSACKCNAGGVWTTGIARTLVSCSQNFCLDTTWLGLAGLPGRDGLILGQPAFGNLVASPGVFSISPLSWNYTAGFNQVVDVSHPFNQTRVCEDAVPSEDMCGTWTIECQPAFNKTYLSYQSIFTYFGTSSVISGDAGQYSLTLITFSDDDCSTPFITSSERGVLQNVASSRAIDGGHVLLKMAPSVNITAHTMNAAYTLKESCPCGGTWGQGTPRTLYSCLSGTCDLAEWNRGNHVGEPQYAGYVRQTLHDPTAIPAELRWTAFSFELEVARNSTLSDVDDIAHIQTMSCPNPNTTSHFCGFWSLPCAAGPGSSAYEISSEIALSGFLGNTATISGSYVRWRTSYDVGQSCSDTSQNLLIYEKGLFTDVGDEPSQGTQGARVILMEASETQVTPMTVPVADVLNLKCPCGDRWLAGVMRTLIACPPTTCNETNWLGASDLGVPGYAIAQEMESSFRISRASSNFSNLFPLDSTAYSYPGAGNCPNTNVVNEFCGQWNQPCRAESKFDSKVELILSGPSSYTMSRTLHTAGYGCSGSNIAIDIEQSGTITISPHPGSPNLDEGRAVQLQPSSMKVTPSTQSAVGYLNTACPCGGQWGLGITRSFRGECHVNTCNNTAWARQPLGVAAYGSFIGNLVYMRMTTFSSSMVQGYNMSLTENDFPLFFLATETCGAEARKNSSNKLSGGSVFLIIFFVFAFVYFVGGTLFNYWRQGSASVPNASFWSSLPSFVGDGLRFSFVECFGMRGGSPGYTRAELTGSGGNSGSYGSI